MITYLIVLMMAAIVILHSTFEVFMPPTLKKLRGHIALGLSMIPSRFLMHAIHYEQCMLGF